MPIAFRWLSFREVLQHIYPLHTPDKEESTFSWGTCIFNLKLPHLKAQLSTWALFHEHELLFAIVGEDVQLHNISKLILFMRPSLSLGVEEEVSETLTLWQYSPWCCKPQWSMIFRICLKKYTVRSKAQVVCHKWKKTWFHDIFFVPNCVHNTMWQKVDDYWVINPRGDSKRNFV